MTIIFLSYQILSYQTSVVLAERVITEWLTILQILRTLENLAASLIGFVRKLPPVFKLTTVTHRHLILKIILNKENYILLQNICNIIEMAVLIVL